MKVMLHHGPAGQLMVYVAKKDLEETVVSQSILGNDHIFVLENGWEVAIANLPEPLQLPKTLEGRVRMKDSH